MLITVFTPTYNRRHLLQRLYGSLCCQTYRDFEWIIIDDGSSDNTEHVVNAFISENKIDIKYIQQENGGKHRAINHGVREAKGELFFIVDSDDLLPADSLETIYQTYKDIRNEKSYVGMSGLDGFADGRIIGSGLPQNTINCNSIEIRNKYHVTGDMSEVFRTDVMKEFPFPEVEGEKFCPEVLVWNRIAQKYKLRYINKIIYTAEYQQEGLTSNIVKIRMKSPIASMMCYAEMNRLNIPFAQKIKAAINYWRFRFCSDSGTIPALSSLWLFTMPIGYMMHLSDKKYLK
jgi:glycosyltransferase involved in cell wall biosynthesis